MSVSSILALLASVAVRPKSVQVARRSEELEARIAELEDDIARANVQARRDQELIDIWRERALSPIGGIPDAAFRPPHLRNAAVALQHQAAMQQAQCNQLAQHLLGAQTLIDTELWCNCVPSRAQVWANSDPE